MTYQGPIIDVHHHLWDYEMGTHKWLGQAASSLKIVGDSRYLERSYMPTDIGADIAGNNVAATVHVEAHWDRTRDGIEETQWLESLDRPANIAHRYIAWAELSRPGAERRIGAHQRCSGRVIGVRESIREHPDPAFAYSGSANWRDPVWQEGVGFLEKAGLVLELLIYPHQAEDVRAIARRFPELRVVVNHSASPIGTGDEARKRFRQAIAIMAQCPNIHVKASNFFRYSEDLSFDDCVSAIARPLVETFGPTRMMFASDYPVASKWAPYSRILDSLKELLQGYSPEEQRAYFHDTASKVYRIQVK